MILNDSLWDGSSQMQDPLKTFGQGKAFWMLDSLYRSNRQRTFGAKLLLRAILCVATEISHVGLVRVILMDERCDLNKMYYCLVSEEIKRHMSSSKCLITRLLLLKDFNDLMEKLEQRISQHSLFFLVQGHAPVDTIMSQFDEITQKVTDLTYIVLFQQLLRAAVRYQYEELANVLMNLDDDRLKTAPCVILQTPLLIALKKKHFALAELFLSNGAHLTVVNDLYVLNQSVTRYTESAIDYACYLDDLPLLKCLLMYNGPDNPECGMILHIACMYGAFNCINYVLSTSAGRSSVNKEEEKGFFQNKNSGVDAARLVNGFIRPIHYDSPFRRKTPLHIVILMALSVHFPNVRFFLSPIVKSLIASGADVNKEDSLGDTPLLYLMTMVNNAFRNKVNLSTKMCQSFVDTARCLLEAGAGVEARDDSTFGPIEVLLNIDDMFRPALTPCRSELYRFANDILTNKETLRLRVDLFTLLLEHGAKSSYGFYNTNLYALAFIAGRIARNLYKHRKDSDFPNRDRLVWGHTCISALTELIRRLVLMESRRTGDIYDALSTRHAELLGSAFVSITSYSTVFGRSQLRDLFLYMLPALHMKQVKSHVSLYIDDVLMDMDDDDEHEDYREAYSVALKALTDAGHRMTLQEIARRAILRSFSTQCLQELPPLELHGFLKKYVLLKGA